MPSSKFFLTLNLGSGGFFLASPGLKKPFPQDVKVKIIRIIGTNSFILSRFAILIFKMKFELIHFKITNIEKNYLQ